MTSCLMSSLVCKVIRPSSQVVSCFYDLDNSLHCFLVLGLIIRDSVIASPFKSYVISPRAFCLVLSFISDLTQSEKSECSRFFDNYIDDLEE